MILYYAGNFILLICTFTPPMNCFKVFVLARDTREHYSKKFFWTDQGVHNHNVLID